MADSNQPFGSGSAQGAASIGDVTTALQGIIRQITSGNAALTAAILAVFPTAVFTGSFTLGAAATTVVANGHVLSSSIIICFPTNAAAGTLMGSAKSLYISAKSAGVSFTVATASAGAAAGTETLSYVILNL